MENVDWTFDRSKNDLKGREGTHISFPHYHLQMRIDGRQFINFNEFHFAFSDSDLFILSLRDRPWLHQNFGAAGSGMQDAVSVDLKKILDLTEDSESEESAQYHFSTLIEAGDQPISGDEIYDMLEEAKRTKKSFAYIAKKHFEGRARV